jgi:hypothetical protein
LELLFEFLHFLVKQLPPFVFIIQIQNLIDDMVFGKLLSHQLTLDEIQNRQMNFTIGLATLALSLKARFAIDSRASNSSRLS